MAAEAVNCKDETDTIIKKVEEMFAERDRRKDYEQYRVRKTFVALAFILILTQLSSFILAHPTSDG